MSPEASESDTAFLIGGGAMTDRIRAHDWSATRIGPPANWPRSLKTAVSIILASKFPACLVWGPDLTTIYNDAFRTILGDKPEALGRPFSEVWQEAWAEIGPIAERAMSGEATFIEHFPLVIERRCHPEQAYFTFCYAPVRDETGTVVGFLDTVMETTGEVKSSAALKAEGERLRHLFQQAPGFVAVLNGPMHVFRFANDAYMHLVGQRDLIGKPVREAFPELQEQTFFSLLDHVYTTGEAFLGSDVRVTLKQATGATEERFLDFIYQPIRDVEETISGIFVQGSDVTVAKRNAEALRASEVRHRQIVNSALDYAIIATDLNGRVTQWSKGATNVLGWSEEEMLGQSTERFFTPEDVAARRVEVEMERALETGVSADERWHVRKGGARFWANGELTPLKDDGGKVIGFVKVLRDRTEQRRAEEHQQLLIHELNHRVKNTLTTVQSLASQTFKGDHASDATREAFEGRLFALAKAHDVLTREQWEGAGLREVLAEVMEPYLHARSERAMLEGPSLFLSPGATLALAMAVHELATNAAKYGSLSVPTGRVSIAWTVSEDALFQLRWQEHGGPGVTAPIRKGFGTRLIERNLAQVLGASVTLTYEPAGVICLVRTPLAELTARSESNRQSNADALPAASEP